jgi:TolB protein
MLNTFRASKKAVLPLWIGGALAAICFASPLGIFEKDTTVTSGQFAGHADFNAYTAEYTLTGAGGEISGKADSFQYVWKRVTGDVTMNADARFTGTGDTTRSQAAVMIRQSLDPDAAYVAALIYGDGGSTLQYRVDKAASTRNADFPVNPNQSSLVHLSIRRHGDTFTVGVGRVGKMGGAIPVSAPITLIMNGPVYMGLAFASPNDPKRQVAAIFSNLSFQGPTAE